MQTFLPYADFARSAAVLDRARLGKQRVEVWQLLRALTDPEARGWVNHPAAKMWRGHTGALAMYGMTCCVQWMARGYADNMRGRLATYVLDAQTITMPSWLGDAGFHASHRSNLLRKDPVWYGQWGWTEGPDLEYVWPVPGGADV